MRRFLAAPGLAGMLLACAPAPAAEAGTRVAQLSRDVTDAVRKQRNEQREQQRRDDGAKREDKR